MKVMFGMLGVFMIAVVGFMYKTKQLEGLKKGNIPGLQGKTFADLDPRKIVETYKNTMGNVESRNKALLAGELPDEKAGGGAGAESASAPQAASPNTITPAAVTPSVEAVVAPKGAERPTKVFRYGMEIQKLGSPESDVYMGKWHFSNPQAASHQVRLNLQPDRAISSVAVRIDPSTNVSRGDNYSMLWKDIRTGQVLVALNDHEYIGLQSQGPKLKGTLFKRGADGISFQRIIEFPLTRP